ncbi:CPBP family intramembrane glutamic endopeptidase [Bacillus sp. 165]|uniref:CPBP family intramembrane glutamic endopeptidase n=1 Tax=Bacillus sp. 165 TaxID=1529117 RepID=UPI001FFE2C07|nr:CPBP family intramembrane glutamic endopeptidase [Bacillus sp. 165]
MLLGYIVVYVIPWVFISDKQLESDVFTVISESLVFFAFPLLWLYYKSRKNNVKFQSYYTKPSKFDWKLVIIATVMGMIFSFGISTVEFYAVSFIIPDLVLDTLNELNVIDHSTIWMTLFTIISVSVYAPIMEETIFRGFFLHRMSRKWSIKRAMIVSSILFGLGHANIIGAAVFGIVMCLLYIKTRSLLMPMIVHALNNFSLSIFDIVSSSKGGMPEPVNLADIRSLTDLWIGVVLTIIGLLWIVPFVYKNWKVIEVKGLPQLDSVYEEEPEKEQIQSQVLIAEKYMAIELPDEIVNQLHLEEEDYVTLKMEGDKLIVTKSRKEEMQSKIS